MSEMSFASAVNDALHTAMNLDSSVIFYGLGATDPKEIFGTTAGLAKKFGHSRVFDTPTSENGMTGIGIGAALGGMRTIMTHQRLDFFLLAMDQLVNSAAKWHYMFGSQISVPITIRLIVGRGWGQGPTHSQNLQAWFAHVPGLKVVMPTTPADAKGLLLSSIFDPNPVVFLEHRWLHQSVGEVEKGDIRVPIGLAKIVRMGKDVTVVAASYLVVEALQAAKVLAEEGIECEVIDLRTISPLDWDAVHSSVEKTRRLIVLDSGAQTGSVAGEIIARVAIKQHHVLEAAPIRLAMPDVPEPTSFGLTKGFFVRGINIYQSAMAMFGKLETVKADVLDEPSPHDVPGEWFKGPF
jgi:pyruvate/2-oxoglutarate/acetoin dehydrogenase E1 component